MHPACCTDPACELAYVDHLRGFAVSASATPTRRAETATTLVKDRVLDQDLDAYKRLRRDHLQPDHIDGCANFERRA